MKKITLLLFLLLSITFTKAQEKKEGWTTKGNFKLLFNQSAFSNWIARGENTLAGNVGVNYDFNYSKDRLTWNNKILASYGLTKSKSTEFEKKTDDRLELNSLVGLKANRKWYYSLLFNFKTQFTTGYKYSKDTNGKEIRKEHTNFFSPASFLLGPGMLWEKNSNLKLNIAPATTKLIIVDKNFTLPKNAYFGVEEGENTRLELGFSATFYHKFNLMENITMENIFALYSNYLESPENIDLDYTMNVVMKVNDHISTNLIFQTIYDDNTYKGFQIREVFGFGFNYTF
jgi:hypothetical protein